MKKTDHIDLLDRFLSGEPLQKEKSRLKEWFRSTASLPEIENYYLQQWERAKEAGMPYEQQQAIWQKIVAELNQNKAAAKRRFSFRKWIPYAAAIILCLSTGISSYVYVQKETATGKKEYVILAEKGQRSVIYLPDGTKVWLNSYTEIRYANNYGKNKRLVSLTGEAYFEVAEDKNCPFIVNADEMQVEALGTTFNIRAYKEEKEIVATLFSGKVQASVGNESVILYPDQHVTFNKAGRQLTTHIPQNSTYARMWRNNELAFEGHTLGDIAVSLNRMYNVQIVFESENIKQYRFSGVIKNNSLENVIEIISLIAPVSYKVKGDTIVLSEKKQGFIGK
ncbi:MAG: DUF4974 domain-containing protein [Tannerellaceae bacterium]|jgi:ferric-dicitrate binding protein FerR (iron transport regulator)|nr:DUF4974 domain-containing protein [Tannerellaceae bacterium]